MLDGHQPRNTDSSFLPCFPKIFTEILTLRWISKENAIWIKFVQAIHQDNLAELQNDGL